MVRFRGVLIWVFWILICGMPEKIHRSVIDSRKLKMDWIRHQNKQNVVFLTDPSPYSPLLSSSPPYADAFHGQLQSPPLSSSSSSAKISPAILFIIVILAVLFFISGLLHLLVRFLIKKPSSASSTQSNRLSENSTADALQRQLQQLFHLHDSGLDQAFIDALPIFQYKEIGGPKEPFDCAVCLCEFSDNDKLRLLPMCSHAFHVNCIDAWLLSNSTCPLCRGTLFTPGFSIENPIFDFDDLREEDECEFSGQKRMESEEIVVVDKGVLPVRLGKFRRLNVGNGEVEGETSSSNLDARRCFSMGSYQYVLCESELRVALNRMEIEQNGNPSSERNVEGKKMNSVAKGESFSISKIWQWPKKGKFLSSSEVQSEMPSSHTVELSWMKKRTEEK